MKKQTAEEIIQEYREAGEKISEIIAEYESTRYRLFKIMLDKLQSVNKDTHSNQVYSQFENALD